MKTNKQDMTAEAFTLSENSLVRIETGARARARGKRNGDTLAAIAAADRLFIFPPLSRRIMEEIRPAAALPPEELNKRRAEWRAGRAEADAAADQLAAGEALARALRFRSLRARGWDSKPAAMAALGKGKGSPERAAMDKAEARADGATLETLRARQTRAGARLLLSFGLSGRIWARACRLARQGAARWMRKNSRREAMNRFELGAAAGVDDAGAWQDWAREIESIYREAFLTAAARGMRAVNWIEAREVRGLSRPGSARAVARLIFERGVRVGHQITGGEWRANPDGFPHKVTGELGFWIGGTIRPAELVGRGEAWQRATREAAREAGRARYGRGGRDGREVSADWSITGNVGAEDDGEDGGAVDWLAVGADSSAPYEISADKFFSDGSLSGRPDRSAGSGRRREFEREARAVIAEDMREARAARRAKLALAAEAEASGNKVRAGSLRGAAATQIRGAASVIANIGGALAGEPIPPEQFAKWMDEGKLTAAGKMQAKRLRERLAARMPSARLEGRALIASGPSIAGDEIAGGSWTACDAIPSLRA